MVVPLPLNCCVLGCHLVAEFERFDFAFVGRQDGQLGGGRLEDLEMRWPAGDFAELVPSRDGDLEPGDVVAVAADGRFMRSSRPYQTSVVGVYSTRPALIGDVYHEVEAGAKLPLAVGGIVPVKVSDEGGAILPGDLLVASSIPGTAMRSERHTPGGVVGKALEAHEKGEGTIRMLVLAR